MIIENKKRTLDVRKRRFLFGILLATVVVLIAYLDFFDDKIVGLTRYAFIAICVGIFLGYYLWGLILDYNYCYFNDLGSKIVFKYYSLAPLSKQHHSIEIEKHHFQKYTVKTAFFGLRNHLILYQKASGGIAKYPPISLGLFTEEERNRIIKSLELFTKLT